MILFIAAAVAAAAPPAVAPPSLAEAEHALAVGRIDQAQDMIAAAVAAGDKGPWLDRLLADLAFAKGENGQALALYQALLTANPGDAAAAERGGIAALRLGDQATAEALLAVATSGPASSWRAWNALGVAADRRGDWAAAEAAYGRASALAPSEARITNNRGWSLLLQGRWDEALAVLEQAVATGSSEARLANNLELARAALAADLPARHPGESDEGYAARLNDAGVVARIRGDERRAIAAFSRAVALRAQYFTRAATNLAAAGGR